MSKPGKRRPRPPSDRSHQKPVRRKLLPKTSHKAGLPPGTLLHIGEKHPFEVQLQLIDYGPDHLCEQILDNPEDCRTFLHSPSVSWINFDGVHETDLLQQVAALFNLHPLVPEDIVNTTHRPKLEEFDNYLFVVLKMLHYDAEQVNIRLEQVSLVLGPGYVLSFQEQRGDVFDGVRQRLRNNKGRLRKMGSDYLAYALLDAVVDSYFAILESLGEQIEWLEDEVINRPTPETLSQIHHFKREMILLRKAVWPLREIIGGLQRLGPPLIQNSTALYLRDIHDHTVQIIDTIETFRDILSGLLDLYLSSVSNRMNEIMKVLTIIATIFIPLTFVAGIYGMNFEFMPELHWPWSYPVLLLLMLGMAGGMMIFFRRKNWF